MDDGQNSDICRVCRSEAAAERPLFHPCICTGSIKWIHQECLVQWMRYSRKEYCELCGYKFSFTPIYSPDMPRRLPIRDIVSGLISSVVTAVKYWFHYTLVAVAWLGIVPLTACRVYRCLFSGSVDSVLTLPLDMFSTENIFSDIFHGCVVVTCTLFAFIGLVWLREQILHGGGPDWLEQQPPQQQPAPAPREQPVPPPEPPVLHPENQPEDEPVPQPPQDNNNVLLQDNNINNNNNNPQEIPPFQEVVEEGAGGGGGGDWNPLDWGDRAAEELTWERLLGLDGSLVFLEHVFWVVSLNTLFILVFAYCPYHIGHFTVSSLGFKSHVNASHFQGLVTTLCGYCVIGMCLVCLHSLAALLSLVKSRRIVGHCYVIVKVSLLSVVEIGVLPLICGWWLDVCSLSLFDASLKDREVYFRAAPGTSMFIHWLIGIVYVYYFASFVLLLREVLRPGVLWFLRNLNEPDFSPIQEMIHLPLVNHIRRLLASVVTFGSAVLLLLWLPIRIIRYLIPNFLPYTVFIHSDSQVNELSLELFILQVILPGLLEQNQIKWWMKVVVRWWCQAVSYLLDLKSYLLGDQPVGQGQQPAEQPMPPAPVERELGAAHIAMHINWGSHTGFQPYNRPSYFPARLIALILLMCATLVGAGVLAFTIPVSLGRSLMSTYPGGKPQHELYTAASGTYLCWLIVRCITLLVSWAPRGRQAFVETVSNWGLLLVKSVIALFLLIGVIPLLSGLLVELVLVIPIRVPLDQTPILWLWQDWALGVLYTKIACALAMMGPDWYLRQAIERVYRDGIRNMQLSFILWNLAYPSISILAMALAFPYVISRSIMPLLVSSTFMRVLIARRIYPCLLLTIIVVLIITMQLRQFAKLYEHIKNDKYLIGRRLVNYHHRPPQPIQQAS